MTFKLFSQPCGGAYPSGMYHNHAFVSFKGDTMNKLNKAGFYEGLHLYTNNENNLFNDSTTYTIGQFSNGLPIGDWTVHCSNGSYSTGQFETGGAEVSSNSDGTTTQKKQGIYAKIGIWKYYDKDSILIKTLRYDRSFDNKGWTNKTYIQDKLGDFVLIDNDFNDKHSLSSSLKKQVRQIYNTGGKLVLFEYKNFWKDISIQYYTNGQIKQKWKCQKIFGLKTNRSVIKKYSETGKLLEKNKGKCWTTIIDH